MVLGAIGKFSFNGRSLSIDLGRIGNFLVKVTLGSNREVSCFGIVGASVWERSTH